MRADANAAVLIHRQFISASSHCVIYIFCSGLTPKKLPALVEKNPVPSNFLFCMYFYNYYYYSLNYYSFSHFVTCFLSVIFYRLIFNIFYKLELDYLMR